MSPNSRVLGIVVAVLLVIEAGVLVGFGVWCFGEKAWTGKKQLGPAEVLQLSLPHRLL